MFYKNKRKEERKLGNKVKKFTCKKVDFVDEGANQQADIKIFKRKEQSAPVVTDLLQDPMKEQKSLFKRLMHSIGKSLGFKDEEIDGFSELSSEGIIQKGNSQTFGEKMTEVKRQKVADEMWSICYALQSSLQSILYDEDLDGATAQSMMEESVSEFDEIIADAISSWSAGKVSGIKKDIGKTDVESLKKFRDHLNENIEKAANIEKGEVEEMLKIDKSKMSPEERAAYDEIVKKYGFEEETVEKSSTVNRERMTTEKKIWMMERMVKRQQRRNRQHQKWETIFTRVCIQQLRQRLKLLESIAKLRKTKNSWKLQRNMRLSVKNQRNWRLF